jgi:hypothetical protein
MWIGKKLRLALAQNPHLGLAVVVCLSVVGAGYACGGSSHSFPDGGGFGASSGGTSGGGTGNDGGGCSSGFCIGSSSGTILNLDGGSSGGPTGPTSSSAKGTFMAPDCAGCKFPPLTATACASSAPAIKIVYPTTGVLVPPNMNSLSVQWTPYGGYQTYEVDFSNNITDTRIITKCSTQTMDTSQPSVTSGGCDLELTQAEWTLLVNANRGTGPVTVTVRGTTDGTCATTSQSSIKMLFASQDLHGAIYYWKSTVSANGTGGQIWEKEFGNTTPEQQVTGTAGSALTSSCNGCHVLSRDGTRMVVESDDDDSDDEYNDVKGSIIDMAMKVVIGGTGGGRVPGTQPPGFSTISPSANYYLSTIGLGTPTPTNTFTLWSGSTGTQSGTLPAFGAATDRPTMPDWSPDGKNVVYILPNKVASWDNGGRNDDDHMFGGSLWIMPYTGNGTFGAPKVFLQSKGENNYYPMYSPDNEFIVFDRAVASTAVTAIDGCPIQGGSGGGFLGFGGGNTVPNANCPNDSFSNPAARLMIIGTSNTATPVDLQKANGSSLASPQNLSNSYPRWSPFVQTYNGGRLLWLAFSSTRDYGVLVRNHLANMYQCYPADSYEQPGASHGGSFDPLCQQPKLWMAAINLSESPGVDPSFPAFYLPFQDIATHNHTPQWTQEVVNTPLPDGGACAMNGGNCLTSPCCPGTGLVCNGSGVCGVVPQ